MLPFAGRSMPITHFISVLLPLPLVPSSTTVSACETDNEMSSSTRTEAYPASRPWMVRLFFEAGLFAKISPFDFRVADHLLRHAIGDLLAGHQHDQPSRKAHHCPHDVLDQHDRDALLIEPQQHGDDFLDLRRRQP